MVPALQTLSTMPAETDILLSSLRHSHSGLCPIDEKDEKSSRNRLTNHYVVISIDSSSVGQEENKP